MLNLDTRKKKEMKVTKLVTLNSRKSPRQKKNLRKKSSLRDPFVKLLLLLLELLRPVIKIA